MMIHIIKRWLYKPTYLDYFSLFTQLQVLLESGITITDAVNKAAAAQSNKVLRESLLQISREIRSGVSTAAAFKNAKIFPPELPAIINAGERSGELAKTFGNFSNTMWLKTTLYSKVKNALLTPKITAAIGFIVFAVFSQAVLPKYKQMYAESNIEMPEVVNIFITVSDSFFHYWYLTALLIYGLYRFCKWFSSTKREKIDGWKLKLWLYRDLHRRLIGHEFTNNLSLMHGAGIVPSEACEMIAKIVSNRVMGQNIRNAGKAITNGTPLPTAFKKYNDQETFDPLLLSFLEIGYETGMLALQMEKMSKVYELEINSRVDSIGTKLTVIVLVPMGLFIVGLYAMSLIPMLGYFNKISGI